MRQKIWRAIEGIYQLLLVCVAIEMLGIAFIGLGCMVSLPAMLWLIGRSQCSFSDTIAAGRFAESFKVARQSIEAGIKVSGEEGNVAELQTPQGRFHVLTPVHPNFSFVLTEQQSGVYSNDAVEVRLGDIVIDCGADYGTFTRKALAAGARLVVAVEPMPLKVSCLRKTFAAEIAAGRVIVEPRGVWNADTTMTLYDDTFIERRNGPNWEVKLTTIDKLASEHRLERVDFIKMDIEGAEKPALEGAAGTLRRFRPRLAVSTEHLDNDAIAIPALIQRLQPAYSAACGPCVLDWTRIRPTTVFFY